MSWRNQLNPRLRDTLKQDLASAELLLELVRLLDELSKPKAPPPPVRVVTWFERPNPYWSDIPVPM